MNSLWSIVPVAYPLFPCVSLRPSWAWSRWRRQCWGRCQQTFNGRWWCRWRWWQLLHSSNWYWQPAKGHRLFPGLLSSRCSTGENADSWVGSGFLFFKYECGFLCCLLLLMWLLIYRLRVSVADVWWLILLKSWDWGNYLCVHAL